MKSVYKLSKALIFLCCASFVGCTDFNKSIDSEILERKGREVLLKTELRKKMAKIPLEKKDYWEIDSTITNEANSENLIKQNETESKKMLEVKPIPKTSSTRIVCGNSIIDISCEVNSQLIITIINK